MKTLTLAILFRGDKILLAMKKRGFGVGKWNGYGGKLEGVEKPIDAIVREIEEESGLVVDRNLLKELGFIDFYFDDKKEWDQRVIIYRLNKFTGEPIETEEMAPEFFDLDKIPYNDMWPADSKWLPYVISGIKFSGEIHFSGTGERIFSCVIE